MEVSQAYEVKTGDVLDFHYSVSGWCKQAKIESLVHKLDLDPRWAVKEFEYNEETGKLRLRLEVIQNAWPVIIIIAAIAAIGAGLFAWLSLDKIEKIISSPVGAALSLGTVAAAIMALWAFAKR